MSFNTNTINLNAIRSNTTSNTNFVSAEYWRNDTLALYEADGENIAVIQTYSNPDIKGIPMDNLFKITSEIRGDSQVSRARRLLREANLRELEILKSLQPGETKTVLIQPVPDEVADSFGIELGENQHLALGHTYLRKAEEKPQVSSDAGKGLDKLFTAF